MLALREEVEAAAAALGLSRTTPSRRPTRRHGRLRRCEGHGRRPARGADRHRRRDEARSTRRPTSSPRSGCWGDRAASYDAPHAPRSSAALVAAEARPAAVSRVLAGAAALGLSSGWSWARWWPWPCSCSWPVPRPRGGAGRGVARAGRPPPAELRCGWPSWLAPAPRASPGARVAAQSHRARSGRPNPPPLHSPPIRTAAPPPAANPPDLEGAASR